MYVETSLEKNTKYKDKKNKLHMFIRDSIKLSK